MRVLIAILSVLTVVFATSTIYLWQRLEHRRADSSIVTTVTDAADPAFAARHPASSHPRPTVDASAMISGAVPSASGILGDEKAQKLEQYYASAPERQLVDSLRGQVADSDFLTSDNAEMLIGALAEERSSVTQALPPDDEPFDAKFFDPPLRLSRDDTDESLRAQADAYYKRLHDRAARILTAGQMATYDLLMRQKSGQAEWQISVLMAQRAEARKHAGQ